MMKPMKIQQLTIQQKRLSSVEAELWVIVHVERIDPSTEIRGCLVGPLCSSIETVQINYPIKPIPRPIEYADNILVGRVIIPEPNVWTPQTPFLYEGGVQLWHEGKCADNKPLRATFKSKT